MSEDATEPKPPAIHDSDLIFLAIKRLERVAEKMQRFEYDNELDMHLSRAEEMFAWAAWNMANRNTSEDKS
jgi:hypothetical protein